MGDRISVIRDKLRAALWPLPTAMLPLAVALFALARWIDAGHPDPDRLRRWLLHNGTGDDARNLLSTLVSAIITMSTLVFSITIVALSLAATQFGSRLVRAYMTDLRSKLALGLFAMTILYCLLALRVVGTEMPAEAVPHVTVSTGLVLGTFCILALLFFLHVVARSIIADEVIRRVAMELEENIATLDDLHTSPQADLQAQQLVLPPVYEERPDVVRAATQGYIRAIDYDGLLRTAGDSGVWVRVEVHAGEFVARGDRLATVHPAGTAPQAALQRIETAVMLGRTRTPTQDLAFSMRHLVDVSLRALSAAINDANTARVVVDHLRGALSRLMEKALPQRVYRDETGEMRVVGQFLTHEDMLHAALSQIRHSAAAQPSVVVSLVLALGHVLEHARLPRHRDLVFDHAERVAQAGLRLAEDSTDRLVIERALTRVRLRLAEQRALDQQQP
ncbi:MAG TPA: DUF2254 domain-containing protein [Ramlibacter sp.]|jgi:uncharacterized membrane protein